MKDTIVTYLKKYYILMAFAAAMYVIFLYATFAGNRICDCEKTENYRPAGTSYGGARFYHK